MIKVLLLAFVVLAIFIAIPVFIFYKIIKSVLGKVSEKKREFETTFQKQKLNVLMLTNDNSSKIGKELLKLEPLEIKEILSSVDKVKAEQIAISFYDFILDNEFSIHNSNEFLDICKIYIQEDNKYHFPLYSYVRKIEKNLNGVDSEISLKIKKVISLIIDSYSYASTNNLTEAKYNINALIKEDLNAVLVLYSSLDANEKLEKKQEVLSSLDDMIDYFKNLKVQTNDYTSKELKKKLSVIRNRF